MKTKAVANFSDTGTHTHTQKRKKNQLSSEDHNTDEARSQMTLRSGQLDVNMDSKITRYLDLG